MAADETKEMSSYAIWTTKENPISPERVDLLVTRNLKSGEISIRLRVPRKVKDAAFE